MKKFQILIVGLAFAVLGNGCTHKFEDYNHDPNNQLVGDVDPESLMEEIIFNGASGMMTRCNSLTGELIQYSATGTSNNSVHRYFLNQGTVESAWNHLAKWAANSDHMYNLAVERSLRNYQAVALTLRALFVSNLTDIWGDIPFSDAFTMWTDDPIEKMKFDQQKDVYAQLLDDLDRANDLYNTSAAFDVTTRDLLFGGDLRMWRKFTNSLHLRLLMRLSNRDGQDDFDISGKIKEIFDNPDSYPVFSAYDEGAIVYFTGVTPFVNSYGSTTLNSWNSRRAAEYIITLMDETRDSRLSLYFTISGTEWEGNPSGMPNQDMAGINAARFNKDNLGQDNSPYAIMKYDEVLYIKLEAIYRGWLPGGQAEAERVHQEALRASYEYWNMINTSKKLDIDEVLSLYHRRNSYEHSLEYIMTMKYIALFWTGYEAWHEYRRTEYPSLVIGTATQNDGILPRRFEYCVTTRETNKDNYDAAVARLAQRYRNGGDNMKTPVWWSKAAIENER